MRPIRDRSFAAATDGASAATATVTTIRSPARTAPATLRTDMLPPQETCAIFVIAAAGPQGTNASFTDFREAVPRVSEFFATFVVTGVYLNMRLISGLRNRMSTGPHLARRRR